MTSSLAHLANALSQAWVAGLWQGFVVVVGVACALRLLPGLTASRRSLVWVGVLALLVGLHLLPLFGRVDDGILLRKAGQQTAWNVDAHWSLALAAIWLTVSAVQGVLLATGLLRVHAIGRRALPFPLPETAQLRLPYPAPVFVSSEVTRPCVVGCFRPRILLPAGLPKRLSADELCQVLVHEQEHIRRKDHWVNLLQKALLAAFPLSPALLLVERRLCVERELACDDRVMRVTGARKAYAACLARIAEHRLMGQGAALVLGAWDRRPALVRRVERILRSAPAEMTGWRARAALGTVLLGACSGAVLLTQTPELVHFTSSAEGIADARPASAAPAATYSAQSNGSYGQVRMVKATLPAAAGFVTSRRPKRTLIHRTRVKTRQPLVLTSMPAPVFPRVRSVEISWQPARMVVTPEGQTVLVPAVMYVASTGQSWVMFQL